MIEVVSPGARTTIQDLGRLGARHLGVGPAGAFDELAARAANLAVGNPEEAALLEVTMLGPELRALAPCVVAVADAQGRIAPRSLASGESLRVARLRAGIRGYVAIRGGIAVEPILGSRSTHVASGIGPPLLAAGMRLDIGDAFAGAPRIVELPAPPDVVDVLELEEPAAGFLGVADPRSDRTGVRFATETAFRGGEQEPEPMLPGMIQLPPDGTPIVLGPDAPTTGGYRVIGRVSRIGMRAIAQARPGATLRFVRADAGMTRGAWKDARAWLDRSI